MTNVIKETNWQYFKRSWRSYKRYGEFFYEFPIAGKIGEIRYNRFFDGKTIPSRWILSLGIGDSVYKRAILLQYYRTGFQLKCHTDCDGHNNIVWFLLKKSKKGGDLYVDGKVKTNLFGRMKRFDGATTPHGVTKLEEGTRLSLIFQHNTPL